MPSRADDPRDPPTPGGPSASGVRSPSPAPPRRRRLIVIVAALTALLCLGGAGVAYLGYDRLTRPDRGAPDTTVDNYLRALLVDRNEVRAALFECRGPSDLSQIHALADDTRAREADHSVRIMVSWGALTVVPDGDRARVDTELTRTVSDGTEREIHHWRFDLVRRDGWRVCAARQVAP